MIGNTLDEMSNAIQPEVVSQKKLRLQRDTQQIIYSVGVMAYNEEANIKRTLRSLFEQTNLRTEIAEVIVVASGCTDRTVDIVQEMMHEDHRIQLIIQEKREGKASAINLFLQQATSSVLVMVGADIIPERNALEKLCLHFIDPTIGMVGARPVPVNEQDRFIGHAVHMLWRLHDRMARRSPKLGEVVAFRNVVPSIPSDTAVDEISIQAIIAKYGLKLAYEPDAVVYNKGPMTIRDFLKQRRRIHAGHLKIRSQEHYEASTMNVGAIAHEVIACAPYTIGTPKQALWTLGTIALEGYARMQGHSDFVHNHSHHVWQAVVSTKALEDEARKLRRICNTQSVIVFHAEARGFVGEIGRERRERLTMQAMRKALPQLQRYLRKGDLLNLNGTDTLVAVLNAERSGAEMIALRLKQVLEMQPIALSKQEIAHLQVVSHAVSFGE